MTRLDVVAAPLRFGLLGGTAVVLTGATVGLGRTGWGVWQVDVVVALIAGGLGAAWWWVLGGVRLPPPDDHPERLRGLVVAAWQSQATDAWNDRLAATDPGFSVPVLFQAIRALAGPGAWGPPQVEGLEAPPGELVLTVRVPGRPTSARLVLTRPLGVPFSRPGGATGPVAGALPGAPLPVSDGWRLARREEAPDGPAAQPAEDPGMPAGRRALLLRDPTFGPEDFDAYVRMVRTTLAEDPAMLDEGARADLAFLGALPDRPIEGVRWLEVELDGWYERVEVVCGGLWLSLARAAGRPEAPWVVWRLQAEGAA